MEMITASEAETKKAASLLAKEIQKKPLNIKGALIIGLEGELGSGKTNFVQGFAKQLRVKQRLTSPTFVLLKCYKINAGQFSYLYHVDCYRLDRPNSLRELDFEQITADSKNILLIEWAEKIKPLLPKNIIWINFKVISNNQRKIIIDY